MDFQHRLGEISQLTSFQNRSDGAVIETEHVYYTVDGLPPGHEAVIARTVKGRWHILRIVDGVPDEWNGIYESVDAALAELQRADQRD